MKFLQLQAFEKHLMASSVSSTYIVACADLDERRKILQSVASHLLAKQSDAELVSCSSKDSFSQMIEHLSTRPLFASNVIVKVDDTADFSKKEKEALESYIIKPSDFAFLVIGMSSLKDFAGVLTSAKNHVVILDLTQEKPWDRQKRLHQWVAERFIKEGKKIPSQIVLELLEACSYDIMLLEQEISKLICYMGEKTSITHEELKKIGVVYSLPTGWQMAEAAVFDAKAAIKDPSFDMSDLLPLLGQVRYHFNLARQLATLLSMGGTKEDVPHHLPQIRQNVIDKYMQLANTYTPIFFDEALKALFKIELLSKNSGLSAGFLWDLFLSQLAQKKIYYAKKTTARTSSKRP